MMIKMTMRMKKTKNLKMMAKLLQTSPIEQKEPPKVNKNFIFLVPVKNRVPLYGHYMMGIVLKVNAQSHRWFRNQSIQQPIRNMILEDILFDLKKSEVTKAFNWFFFFQHKSLVIVLYLVYHIGLQQCWTRVSRTRTSQFPAVLHTASLAKFFRQKST